MSEVLQALKGDLWGAAGIAGAIVVLFVAAESWKRLTQVQVEWTRKFVHAGAGAIVFTFPWVIDSVWTVTVLCVAFSVLLIAGKKTGLLSSIHSVERKTSGAYFYPFAVLGLFYLSKGDAVMYCVPLLVMALADSTAAMVGLYRGFKPYKVLDGDRTVEGTITFFVVSYLIVLTALVLSGHPTGPSLALVAFVVAAITTTVEAVSVRGADNLFIPYAAWMTLHTTLGLGLEGLLPWLGGMGLSFAVVAVTYRRGHVTVAGGMTLFLIGTAAFALGGWLWWLPFLSVWIVFLFSRVPAADTDLDAVFGSTAGPLVIVLLFAHTGNQNLFIPFLVTQSVNSAILAVYFLDRKWRQWLSAPVALVGAGVPVLPAFLLGADVPIPTVLLGGMVGLLLFTVLVKAPFKGRRMVASLACGVFAWILLTP